MSGAALPTQAISHSGKQSMSVGVREVKRPDLMPLLQIFQRKEFSYLECLHSYMEPQ